MSMLGPRAASWMIAVALLPAGIAASLALLGSMSAAAARPVAGFSAAARHSGRMGAPTSASPPKLAALERKMRALRVNSERGSVIVTLKGSPLGHGGRLLEPVSSHRSKRRRAGAQSDTQAVVRLAQLAVAQLPTSRPVMKTFPFLTADFETSASPRLVVVRAELFGAIPFQMRQIGEQIYLRTPLLTPPAAGGRRWISISPAERAQQQAPGKGSSSGSPFGTPEAPETGFDKVAELIGEARSAMKVGPATIDGQQTIEFKAKLDMRQRLRRLAASIPSLSSSARQKLQRAKATLDLFIASSGVPVRTRIDVELGKTGIESSEDIVATEIPVLVTAPPASETISEAELKELQEQESGTHLRPLSKRERAEQRRFNACMNRRLPKRKRLSERKFNKIWSECERATKRGAK